MISKYDGTVHTNTNINTDLCIAAEFRAGIIVRLVKKEG
jgi:hypothetical protein